MTDIRIFYNDEPVLEVGGWRVLCPNAYGKKYKNLEKPLLIHKCSANAERGARQWSDIMIPERPEGKPHCGHCDDPVPEEIQGLLAMYYWDKTEVDDTSLPPAGNSCGFGNRTP